MNWDFMSKMFYPKLGGNAVKWQVHKTQKPELNLSSLPVRGFLHGPNCKQSACNVGDPGLIPGSGRSPGEGNGNPLQYSCLGNAMDREAWWATVHADTTKQQLTLSLFYLFTSCMTMNNLTSLNSEPTQCQALYWVLAR